MIDQATLMLIVQIVLIVGAVNWALVAIDKKYDLVEMITGGGDAAKIVKLAVGAAGAYSAYTLYKMKNL